MAELQHCYRHPDRETYVSCSECGRPICPDCMSHGPVGIRCPDHATAGGRVAAPKRVARSASRSLSAYGPFVTYGLIAANVGVYVLQLALGSGIRPGNDWIFQNGALYGPLVAEGEWWRLVSCAFLHANILHLAMNMLVLWFIGPPVEDYFGPWRYLLMYLIAGVAGSAGALLVTPDAVTVGASGAIWGIMGAAVVLEAKRIYVFGGQAMGLLVLFAIFTLANSFAGGNVSVGGHFGGLAGGAACALAFTSLRRSPGLATLSMVAVGVASIAVAFASV